MLMSIQIHTVYRVYYTTTDIMILFKHRKSDTDRDKQTCVAYNIVVIMFALKICSFVKCSFAHSQNGLYTSHSNEILNIK